MMNQGNPQPDGFVDDTLLHGARQQLEGHIGQVIDQIEAYTIYKLSQNK